MSILIWDVPYAYGPIYAYGAEHPYPLFGTREGTVGPSVNKVIATYTGVHLSVEYIYCKQSNNPPCVLMNDINDY